MKSFFLVFALVACSPAYAGSPLNCPGNSCNAPPFNNGTSQITAPTTVNVDRLGVSLTTIDVRGSVINHQINRAPVTSIVSGVTITNRTGSNTSTRVSGNSITANAVGNSSVIRITRGQ